MSLSDTIEIFTGIPQTPVRSPAVQTCWNFRVVWKVFVRGEYAERRQRINIFEVVV